MVRTFRERLQKLQEMGLEEIVDEMGENITLRVLYDANLERLYFRPLDTATNVFGTPLPIGVAYRFIDTSKSSRLLYLDRGKLYLVKRDGSKKNVINLPQNTILENCNKLMVGDRYLWIIQLQPDNLPFDTGEFVICTEDFEEALNVDNVYDNPVCINGIYYLPVFIREECRLMTAAFNYKTMGSKKYESRWKSQEII